MKKVIIWMTLASLLFITACQSAESKEVMEYHNDFVEEVISKIDEIVKGYGEMDIAETDEEALEIGNTKILPTLSEIRTYMDAQDPKEEDTKEYHKIRLEWFDLYEEIVTTEMQALDDYLNDQITEDELNEIVEGLNEISVQAEELAIKAEEKVDELAEKYDFEVET